MNDLIKWKRGLKSKLPKLNLAEPALVTDEERIYVGGLNGNIAVPNKQDIDAVKVQLADNMYQINIKHFPRLAAEIDDAPRLNRAVEFLRVAGGGTLKLNGEKYYLKTRHIEGCFIKLYPNININGVGKDSIFYIDDNSENDMHGMFTCMDTHDAIYSNFRIDTSLRTNWTDSDFYDGFYLRYVQTEVNVFFENLYFEGKHYQTNINISHLKEENALESEFGSNLKFINCSFYQMSYPSVTNNVLFKNCKWLMDLDAARPVWDDNAAQTAFKATGKNGFINNFQVIDCKIISRGNRNLFVPFEIFRTNSCIIDNLEITTEKSGYCDISSFTIKGYVTTEKETNCTIRNCIFDGVSVNYGELSNVLIENTKFYRKGNVFYSTWKQENKQSPKAEPISKLEAIDCFIDKSCSRISLNESGKTQITFKNCKINYDRDSSEYGGISNSGNAIVVLDGCRFVIAKGDYCFNLNSLEKLIIKNTIFLKGENFNAKTNYLVVLKGNNKDIIIYNIYSEVHFENLPIVRMYDINTSISGIRDIEYEKLQLIANGRLYEVTIDVNGQLVAIPK